jgi:hypothetical protein
VHGDRNSCTLFLKTLISYRIANVLGPSFFGAKKGKPAVIYLPSHSFELWPQPAPMVGRSGYLTPNESSKVDKAPRDTRPDELPSFLSAFLSSRGVDVDGRASQTPEMLLVARLFAGSKRAQRLEEKTEESHKHICHVSILIVRLNMCCYWRNSK